MESKGIREKSAEPKGLLASQSAAAIYGCQDKEHVGRELGENLPTDTAGGHRFRRTANHGARNGCSVTGGDHGRHRQSFGTQGGPKGRILHIAACKHATAPRQYGGTHRKRRVRRIGLRSGALSGKKEPLRLRSADHLGAPLPSAIHARRSADSATRRDAAIASTSACSSARVARPAARLVRHESAATRTPMCRRAITSWTVLIPTAWAPSIRSILTSAGVSYCGPSTPA